MDYALYNIVSLYVLYFESYNSEKIMKAFFLLLEKIHVYREE